MARQKSLLERMMGRRAVVEFRDNTTYSARIQDCDAVLVYLADVFRLSAKSSHRDLSLLDYILGEFDEEEEHPLTSVLVQKMLLLPSKQNTVAYLKTLKRVREIGNFHYEDSFPLPDSEFSYSRVEIKSLVSSVRNISDIRRMYFGGKK